MTNNEQRVTNDELRATNDELRATNDEIRHSPIRPFAHSPYLILALAMGLAIFLRFYKLGQVPPALNGDEAVFGSGALQILQNGPTLSVAGQGGAGVLASYIVAVFFALSEPGKMALRFQTSFFGVLTVLLLFFAARVLFQSTKTGAIKTGTAYSPSAYANWVAAIAALFLATSYSHATISRISFAIVHLPALELLAVWLFWLAWRSGSR
ncbi:MAG TPA: hypothetical protein ENK24_05840, partial [Anaerolineae bacterium]|nr:hypothetical protein [Anaerolineae bacterium]